MTTKMVFHGSDIEKICDYYHLNKEDIVKFGANVNPLGLSASVKKEIAENVDLFSSYPDRDYVSLRNTISEYCNLIFIPPSCIFISYCCSQQHLFVTVHSVHSNLVKIHSKTPRGILPVFTATPVFLV